MALLGFAGMLALAQIHKTVFDNLPWKLLACTMVFWGFFSLTPGRGKVPSLLILLGACSYSLYLWHWPIIYFGNFYGNGSASAYQLSQVIILLTVQVPLVCLVTWLSYYYIERNARMSVFIKLFNQLKNNAHKLRESTS